MPNPTAAPGGPIPDPDGRTRQSAPGTPAPSRDPLTDELLDYAFILAAHGVADVVVSIGDASLRTHGAAKGFVSAGRAGSFAPASIVARRAEETSASPADAGGPHGPHAAPRQTYTVRTDASEPAALHVELCDVADRLSALLPSPAGGKPALELAHAAVVLLARLPGSSFLELFEGHLVSAPGASEQVFQLRIRRPFELHVSALRAAADELLRSGHESSCAPHNDAGGSSPASLHTGPGSQSVGASDSEVAS